MANQSSNTLTELRATDGHPLGTFPMGNGPSGLAFDGAYMWIPNINDNTVSKVASTGAIINTYTFGNRPNNVAFDGASIWVTNSSSNTVSKK